MSCPDCFKGHIHDGTPKGTTTTLHGLDVYVAEPSTNPESIRGIVVIIPDAFGWEFVNNRILADNYAEKGRYKVYLPDFMNGHAAPLWFMETMPKLLKGASLYDWVTKPYHFACAIYGFAPFLYHNRFGKSFPLVKSFVASVRQNEGAQLPIAAAGFCWGGKHTVNLAHGLKGDDGKLLINAAFTGHPSFVGIPDEIEKIQVPTSFALGDLDFVIKMPHIQQIQEILEKNDSGEVKVYHGASHGFCVRADNRMENAEAQATEAEDQALDWFNKNFARVTF